MSSATDARPRHQADDRLAELWRHRQTLSEAEWSELYQLIVLILRSAHFKELSSLVEEREELIQGFFVHAVMQRGLNGSTATCEHAGALISFFRNFVIDELRSRNSKNQPLLAGDLGADSEVDQNEFLEHCANEQDDSTRPHHQPEEILIESGLSIEHVITSAHAFITKQEDWVWLYLSAHFCPDDDDSLPLYELAKRHRIPSYHARAARLGITRKKTDVPGDFSKTLLGGWLVGLLGTDISLNNSDVCIAALKVLCLAVAAHDGGLI